MNGIRDIVVTEKGRKEAGAYVALVALLKEHGYGEEHAAEKASAAIDVMLGRDPNRWRR